jgi:anaerobic magnesium-protoporphyrin IX monomethyl ester cyclase
MKVLLIQPPIEDFYDTSIRTYPLGLLYLAAAVADIAEVAILDARSGRRHTLGNHGFPELETFYRTDVATPLSFFGRYGRYGMDRTEIGQAIATERPDTVGISSLCSAYEQQAMEIAEIAKKVNRDTTTVIGGIHPTVFPERVLSSPNVDYCVRGEGEEPFRALIAALDTNRLGGLGAVKGVCYREDGGLHLSPAAVSSNIDLLPQRRLVPTERYRIGRKPYAFLLTSRGCPHSCGFCGKPSAPYRRRNLGSIAEEIDECLCLGIQALDFEDDMLNADRKTFLAVLEILNGRGLTLSAMNGIYPGAVDATVLQAMHRAGFQRLNFSLVDASSRVLDRQNRQQQESFTALLPFLEASPFLTEVHFIIGLPGQSPEDALQTLVFLMEKRLLLGPSMFYLAPGSPLYATLSEAGQLPYDFRHMRSSVMAPVNPAFPRPVTYTFMKLVRFINYVKGLVDKYEGPSRLSEILDTPEVMDNGVSHSVLTVLLQEKRLVRFDTTLQALADEPVDQDLVASFFAAARKGKITGYKTNRSIRIDV